MGKIYRTISADGGVVCSVIDSTDLVSQAERIHTTSATVTAALGRLLTAASLMGSLLKGEDDSLTLRLVGNGPASPLLAVSDSHGNVRGYAAANVVELPLNRFGKLDVAGAVGSEGTLYVIRDLGLKEPYVGQVPIVSGEIAEDITSYYAHSEQIPTVCALGVLVNTDLTVLAAGGYLIQLLPGADEETITRLEENVGRLDPVTTMLSHGMTPESITAAAMEGFAPEVLDSFEVAYRCGCTRERVERALIGLGREELLRLSEEQPTTELGCQFCNKKYHFSAEEIRRLAEK